MLPDETNKLLSEVLARLGPSHTSDVMDDVRKVKVQLAQRGLSNSGSAISQTIDIYVKHFHSLCRQVVGETKRVLETTRAAIDEPAEASIQTTAKSLLDSIYRSDLQALEQVTGSGSHPNRASMMFRPKVAAAIAGVKTEIQLLCAGLRANQTSDAVPDTRSSTGMNKTRRLYIQKLLLKELRDQHSPPELKTIPEKDLIHCSALLINGGYAEGTVIKDINGFNAATSITELTGKGHEYLEQLEELSEPQRQTQSTDTGEAQSMNGNSKLIFISHSSIDEDLAEAIEDLLCAALHLHRGNFLCTSVPGSKLRGGDDTDQTLRSKIRDVPVFLSIISADALASTYVLFELGARWGFEKFHIPLLVKGIKPGDLKEPLKGKNGLVLIDDESTLQLVEDVAAHLGLTPQPSGSYLKKVRAVVNACTGSDQKAASRGPSAVKSDQDLLQLQTTARQRLAQCTEILRSAIDTRSAIVKLRDIQTQLQPQTEQITLIIGDRIMLHADTALENKTVAGAWEDVSGQSLFREMAALGCGIIKSRIKGYPNRQTIIAFESLTNPSCMVVVEAHLPD